MVVWCFVDTAMIRVTLRLSDEVHDKLRWLAFSQRRSQHSIILELVEKGIKKVTVPKEIKRGKS